MVDAVFPRFDPRADRELHALTSEALQLLSMLEVVHTSNTQDATHAVELAAALEALASRVRDDGPHKGPLDPGGRKREWLGLCVSKANTISRSALHMARISPSDVASVHTLLSLALSRLVLTCERLSDALRKHDQRFESSEASAIKQARA